MLVASRNNFWLPSLLLVCCSLSVFSSATFVLFLMLKANNNFIELIIKLHAKTWELGGSYLVIRCGLKESTPPTAKLYVASTQ